jgi:eukaryotic-like serine/threonine-protein kinase
MMKRFAVRGQPQVGSYPAGISPYRALDMAGNVWEWVNDWYASDYYSTYPVDGWPNNPTGPADGTSKGVRGGSWYNFQHVVRAAFRSYYTPPDRYDIGFRCAGGAPGR